MSSKHLRTQFNWTMRKLTQLLLASNLIYDLVQLLRACKH